MRSRRGRIVTVESLAELDRRLEAGARTLHGWRLVGLDLRGHSERLRERDTSRATFAGCRFAAGDAEHHARRGALILPAVPDTPIDPQRSDLYTADELYDTTPYAATLDARAYAWQQERTGADAALARALHDEGIDGALDRWVQGRRLVGVMGGHALRRGEPGYADAARLGHLVGADFTVATGGGPGAMEAANLGARLAGSDAAALDEAIGMLTRAPSYHPSPDAWVDAARDVLIRFPLAADSLGVPTWHYGHEPPNLFATAIAKYFRNALREAILLELCGSGIVFLPGAGGTVQEIFQDACENYYATEERIAPMVLVGHRHWTEVLPAWPLLQSLAKGRPMERHVHLVDSVDDAAALLMDPTRPM